MDQCWSARILRSEVAAPTAAFHSSGIIIQNDAAPRWGGRAWLLAVATVAAILCALLWSQAAHAQDIVQPPPDAACKLCHVDNEGVYTLPSGETLPLGIDLTALDESVHGVHAAAPVYCTDCHSDRQRYQFPHQPNPAQDLVEYRAGVAQNCEQCHATAEVHNPGHLQAADSSAVPNCVDCHGGHEVEPVAVFAADPVATCQTCHQSFENKALGKVHAEIVTNLGPDQTCETCHASTPQSTDAQCQTCHSLLTSQLTLVSGDQIDLHVNPQDIIDSVHGERVFEGIQYTTLQCTDCHKDQAVSGYPHAEIDAVTRRSLTVAMEQICQDCHLDIYDRTMDGIHAQHVQEGDLRAATCADCHGNHAIQDPDDPREHVSQTCGNCHAVINEQYAASVHGAALLGEDNPDVPVCTDCHGVHNIPEATTAEFRMSSPNMCGQCHADTALMEKYGISTDVFETYVADFHGTTVTLFEHNAPGEATNKAVCYDCHGVHNILPANDENSQIIKENLLVTCQQCHPDATANFPDSWTSHFKPSIENNPLVYLVDLFYAIVIPFTVGGFMLFIGSDVYRRVIDRRRGKNKGDHDHAA